MSDQSEQQAHEHETLAPHEHSEQEPHEMDIDTTRPEEGSDAPSEGVPDDGVVN